MDLILYRYLLRRLVYYPVTFSRNKNFNSYSSPEGEKAIKRAKVLKTIIRELTKEENKANITVEEGKNNCSITINDEHLHIESKYIVDEFEKEIIKENLGSKASLYFNG